MFRSIMNGKRILGLGVVLTILTAGIIWQVTAPEGQAQSVGGFSGAILLVDLSAEDVTTLTTGGSATPTIVSVTGEVSAATTEEPVGTVRIWGIKTGGPGLSTISTVNLNYELPGFNGTIEAQGTLTTVVDILDQDAVVAITGGTGTFRGANGEATIQNNGGGHFTFRLKEVKRR